jgi:hypothetical protein
MKKKIRGKKAMETLHAPRSGKKISDTVRAFKRSFSDAGKSFSEGTDRVAEAAIDSRKLGKGVKAGNIKDETVKTFKNLARDMRENLKGVSFGDAAYSASYGLGRLSRKIKDGCSRIIHVKQD